MQESCSAGTLYSCDHTCKNHTSKNASYLQVIQDLMQDLVQNLASLSKNLAHLSARFFAQVSVRFLHMSVQDSCSALLPHILATILARTMQDLNQDSCTIPAKNASKWPYYLQECKLLASHTRLYARRHLFLQEDLAHNLSRS